MPSPNIGGELRPNLLVIHYTASGPESDIAHYFANSAAKVSAHLVVKRDGTITQCVPFNVVGWHAGQSTWRYADGQVRIGLNSHSIGIELENWGPLQESATGWVSWTGKPVDPGRVVKACHRFGAPDCGWETFTEQQIEATISLAQALCAAYSITEIVGHDDISPGRKSDPGPAFNMDSFRSRVFGRGQDGAAEMVVRSTTGLNLRTGPGVNFALARPEPLPDGARVSVQQAEGQWRLVSALDENDMPYLTGWVNSNWLRSA